MGIRAMMLIRLRINPHHIHKLKSVQPVWIFPLVLITQKWCFSYMKPVYASSFIQRISLNKIGDKKLKGTTHNHARYESRTIFVMFCSVFGSVRYVQNRKVLRNRRRTSKRIYSNISVGIELDNYNFGQQQLTNTISVQSSKTRSLQFEYLQIDFSSVHLISSTPGRHTGPDLNKFGHLKLRQVISVSKSEHFYEKNNCLFRH